MGPHTLAYVLIKGSFDESKKICCASFGLY